MRYSNYSNNSDVYILNIDGICADNYGINDKFYDKIELNVSIAWILVNNSICVTGADEIYINII